MNTYEKIYSILIESTPIGREKSKNVGRGFAAVMSHIGKWDLVKHAKREGKKAVSQGDLQTRLKRAKAAQKVISIGREPKDSPTQ